MSDDSSFVQLLDLAAGLVLVCAFVVLWRRSLTAVIRAVAVQGMALAGVAALLGLHEHEIEPLLVAALILLIKGGIVPVLLLRIVRADDDSRDVEPLVNVSAAVKTDAGGGVQNTRIAVGGVSCTPRRVTVAEETIKGKKVDQELAQLAGQSTTRGARPLNFNHFKVPLMQNLVMRSLRDATA